MDLKHKMAKISSFWDNHRVNSHKSTYPFIKHSCKAALLLLKNFERVVIKQVFYSYIAIFCGWLVEGDAGEAGDNVDSVAEGALGQELLRRSCRHQVGTPELRLIIFPTDGVFVELGK